MKTRFTLIFFLLQLLTSRSYAQVERMYIANDDHTDYLWTVDEATYENIFIETIDKYLDQIDSTEDAGLASDFQARYNLDGNFWIWNYEKNRNPDQVNRLMDRIHDGHISVPLNPLVILYGSMPAEVAIRGMYYAGRLERRFNLDINLAVSMENQVMPLGMGSLWAGCGAKFSWRGICGCASLLTNFDRPALQNRDHEVYYYGGLDNHKILMKWYSLADFAPNCGTDSNQSLGGYAEAFCPDSNLINRLHLKSVETDRLITGAFGYGWDNAQTYTNRFITLAQESSSTSRRVIVSNEEDFFEDFENVYADSTPTEILAMGNEWELAIASLAETSALVKRSTEKLRIAEAMATLVAHHQPNFSSDLDALRDSAWMSIGLYFEHDIVGGGIASSEQLAEFHNRMVNTYTSYVDSLYNRSLRTLCTQIPNTSDSNRFVVFNSLNWTRSDVADIIYNGNSTPQVTDLSTGLLTPAQIITKEGINYLRILAKDIPSVGYKIFKIENEIADVENNAAILTGDIFENDFFQLTVTTEGVITSLIDKINNDFQCVAEINGRYFNDMGSGESQMGSALSVENAGPVSVTLKASSNENLVHNTAITLFKDIERIDIENQITQALDNSVRTNSFSTSLMDPSIWHEEMGAVILAKLDSNGGNYAHRNARYDWLTLNHFANVSNSDYTLNISNRDCYFMKTGNSTLGFLDEEAAQINVLLSGQTDAPTFNLGMNNQNGNNIFNQFFSVTAHAGIFDPYAAMKSALEAQCPFAAGFVSGNVSILPELNYSFLTNTDSSAILWTIKPAEEGMASHGCIGRFWNMYSNPVSSIVTFPYNLSSAAEVSHIETDIGAISTDLNGTTLDLGANQMQSFRFRLDSTSNVSNSVILQDEFIIYPNPAAETISVTISPYWQSENSRIIIYKDDGSIVGKFNVKSDVSTLDISKLDNGIYYLQILQIEKRSQLKKIIVTR